MFVLLAGRDAAGDEPPIERMAGALRGCGGTPRLWREPRGYAAAAALKPAFLPEDEHDAQPLAGETRLFVCQARLDNRDELAERLGLAGARIADSALLAAAYDRWGEECVDQLAGDYAFAAWHKADGRVVAAVDPLGQRRLLWARIGDGIALAAQLPALLAHPRVSREPNLAALARLLDSGIDRTTTPFAVIRALPGAHLLIWRGGAPSVARWWRPAFAPTVWYGDPRDYVEEARALFTAAVRSRLRSTTPLSSTVSGGLDSGAVTSMSARLLAAAGERLTAYTSVPEVGLERSQRPGWEPDDGPYAAETVAQLGNVDHQLVAPDGRCILDAAETVGDRSQTPVKGATNLLWLDSISRRVAASGSKVLLTGQRGNAAFSWGGENTILELALSGRPGAALNQARREAGARETSLARVLAGAVRGGLSSLSARPSGAGIGNPALAFIRRPWRPSPQARGNEYALPLGTRAHWAAFATVPMHGWSPDPVLQWGIDHRDPTADRRLIERLLAFPQAAFRVGGRHRGLARELAAGLLPERVRLRRTQGAQVPEAPSLIAAHAPRYRAVLAEMRRSAWCRELFEFGPIGELLERFAAGYCDYLSALRLDRAFNLGLFLVRLESGDDR